VNQFAEPDRGNIPLIISQNFLILFMKGKAYKELEIEKRKNNFVEFENRSSLGRAVRRE
jgi:hypothetical protein